jgi:hypothetical protein
MIPRLLSATAMQQTAVSSLDYLRAKRQIAPFFFEDFFDLPSLPVPDGFEHLLTPIETLRGAMNTVIFAVAPIP